MGKGLVEKFIHMIAMGTSANFAFRQGHLDEGGLVRGGDQEHSSKLGLMERKQARE